MPRRPATQKTLNREWTRILEIRVNSRSLAVGILFHKIIIWMRANMTFTPLAPAIQSYLDSLGMFGWQLGLERIEKLCRFLGNPERQFPVIHVAGTNGKGSTCAILASLARSAGLRCGLYTSPHLVHVNERIQIDGVPINGEELGDVITRCRKQIDALGATYFEALTAASFALFAQRGIDLAIIETGLGGRLDATNVVTPDLTIITSIGLEHQQYLGQTLAEIAAEKAGIIKPGKPCVSGVRQPAAREVISRKCEEMGAEYVQVQTIAQITECEISRAGNRFSLAFPQSGENLPILRLNLLGRHQIYNARLAVIGVRMLPGSRQQFSEASIRRGLERVRWPARLQVFGEPPILMDAAHNADGMRVLIRALGDIFPGRRLHVVMALMNDKPIARILRLWKSQEVRFYFGTAPTTRSFRSHTLSAAAKELGFACQAFESVADALQCAASERQEGDLVCVTGSHYAIGESMAAGKLPYPYADTFLA